MLTAVLSPPWIALAALIAAATLVWLVSLALRDASIVDVCWGLGFVLAAWLHGAGLASRTPRAHLVLGLVALWGVRLSLHILSRGWGRGEDYRYRAMRARDPHAFPLRSLASVFWLQSCLIWLISAPLYSVARSLEPARLSTLDFLGLGLFAAGFGFEAVGDWQLQRFRRDPANAGLVLDRGLWRYTRHPNYFGDALVWWSFYCFAAATPGGWKTVASPLLMSILLMRVSGVTLLEQKLRETRPGYRRYVEETSAFFPRRPRRAQNWTRTPKDGSNGTASVGSSASRG